MTDVYNEYKRNCAINASGPIKPLSHFTFDKVIQDKNIAFQPRKRIGVIPVFPMKLGK